jgi:hypothetical protein
MTQRLRSSAVLERSNYPYPELMAFLQLERERLSIGLQNEG